MTNEPCVPTITEHELRRWRADNANWICCDQAKPVLCICSAIVCPEHGEQHDEKYHEEQQL